MATVSRRQNVRERRPLYLHATTTGTTWTGNRAFLDTRPHIGLQQQQRLSVYEPMVGGAVRCVRKRLRRLATLALESR
ncbi:unnamed protein product [Macrosiphum euphorbiae]|uniref:Uncharacterized protein n=1 Tax=Macrosiphum euphorbiae TaxID=13131 RepID=A0AAV0WAM5_9HEMI|nr:unnamed protein product [Macrosiphum euphorbiae]